jgi:hypothetical protein
MTRSCSCNRKVGLSAAVITPTSTNPTIPTKTSKYQLLTTEEMKLLSTEEKIARITYVCRNITRQSKVMLIVSPQFEREIVKLKQELKETKEQLEEVEAINAAQGERIARLLQGMADMTLAIDEAEAEYGSG